MLDKELFQKYMTGYLSKIACTVQYKWDDKFSREEVRKATDQLMSELKDVVNFAELTKSDAEYLGCIQWDDRIHLLPIYLLPIIPIGTKLVCISGEEVIYNGSNIDNDTRVGMLAYGIEFPD